MRNYSIVVGFVFGAFLLWLSISNINPGETFTLLKQVNLSLVLLGLLVLGFNLWLKAWRWQILLETQLPKKKLFAINNIGYLVNNLLPARMGELVRIYLAGRKEQVGITKTFCSILIEKGLDTLVLVSSLLVVLLASPLLKQNLQLLLGGATVSKNWQYRWQVFAESLKMLTRKRFFIKLIILTMTIWSLEIIWIDILLRSLNLQLPLLAPVFLAAVINLGLFIPAPPGYIGVYHFLATFALLPWGVDKSQAFSYAFLEHSLEYLFLSILGLWSAFQLSFNPFRESQWRKVKQEPGV